MARSDPSAAKLKNLRSGERRFEEGKNGGCSYRSTPTKGTLLYVAERPVKIVIDNERLLTGLTMS